MLFELITTLRKEEEWFKQKHYHTKNFDSTPVSAYFFCLSYALSLTHAHTYLALLNACAMLSNRLNEISLLCAELTAHCNALSSDWLGVLKFLCCSSIHSSGFIDVLTQIDVSTRIT